MTQPTFRDLLSQKSWSRYEDYIKEGVREYSTDLAREISVGKEMKKQIRKYLTKNFDIKSIPKDLTAEGALLSKGRVIGIDGTVGLHKTISGTMAQIGIVAVNYLNEKIKHSYYISEARYKEDATETVDYLFSHERHNKVLSNLVIRAILLYRERELGLVDAYKDKIKLYHGPLLPFELMSDLGKLRALDSTLELLRRIVLDKRCCSIISRSQNDAYIRLGLSLEPGEYTKLHKNLGREIIDEQRLLFHQDKWREEDFIKVNSFLQQDAGQLCVGIIKISQRPYVFHAHDECFDLAARVIARDSAFQREKGFPLLIDYADSLCSSLFRASDFNKIIEYQLAKEGEFLSETSEEALRQK
jgi:hypothetical protein